MAAKFEATIVPFAGIGVEDAISIIADSSEIQQIPIYGQRAIENARANFPQARRSSSNRKLPPSYLLLHTGTFTFSLHNC